MQRGFDNPQDAVPVHHTIREHQPYIPRHGYTIAETSLLSIRYEPTLPVVPRQEAFDTLVAEAKRLLAELDALVGQP